MASKTQQIMELDHGMDKRKVTTEADRSPPVEKSCYEKMNVVRRTGLSTPQWRAM